MQNNMCKIAIGIVIILLFLGAGVLPSISGSVVDYNTIDHNKNNSSKIYWIIYIGLIKDKSYHRHDRVEFTGLKVFYIHRLWDEPLSYGFLHDVYVGYDINYKIGILTRHFVYALFFVQ